MTVVNITVHFLLLFIVTSQLILHDGQLWTDDSNDLMGWQVVQTSGYDIPVSNPIVNVNGQPKYHGPFPKNYDIQRTFACNTIENTRITVSYTLHYCNTDNADRSTMLIQDSADNILLSKETRLGNKKTELTDDLVAVQGATLDMYFNHTSSTTNIPQCSNSSATKWYSKSQTNDNDYTIINGHQNYTVIFQMTLTGSDEYVAISDVFLQCVDVSETPTTNPTSEPTVPTTYPTANPTLEPTLEPTVQPTLNPTTHPTAYPTLTFVPTIYYTSTEILTVETYYSTMAGELEEKAASLMYVYIILITLAVLAFMLCICCIIFWIALGMHRKTDKELKLKKNTETAHRTHAATCTNSDNTINSKELELEVNVTDEIEITEHRNNDNNPNHVIPLEYRKSDNSHISF